MLVGMPGKERLWVAEIEVETEEVPWASWTCLRVEIVTDTLENGVER